MTPVTSQFLYGYPHVPRISTGVHTPLYVSAMYLSDGAQATLLMAADVIFLTKQQVAEARDRITAATNVPRDCILIAATHTHSGPVTMRMISNASDPVVPPPDPRFLHDLLAGLVDAAVLAAQRAEPARLAFDVALVKDVGANRHDPRGPALPETPVLVARSAADDRLIGLLAVGSMHPTVLHEDSRLISADFPGSARRWLQNHFSSGDLPFVYFMGAAGNQSPRHLARENTPREADRLGEILGRAVAAAVHSAGDLPPGPLRCLTSLTDLPPRKLPPVDAAEAALAAAAVRLETLRRDAACSTDLRTAECDWLGAEETLTLARAAANGSFATVVGDCLPAEVQAIGIGPWSLICWPGEVFAEFALEVRGHFPNAFVITLANGDLQGYLVTSEAVRTRCYEAGNAVFASPASGRILVETAIRLLQQLSPPPSTRVSLDPVEESS